MNREPMTETMHEIAVYGAGAVSYTHLTLPTT